MKDPRYPIGQFKYTPGNSETRSVRIESMRDLPYKLNRVASGLDEKALLRTYRKDSWNVRQLLHHLPDSHMNGYIRCKLALSERTPTVKPYNENDWANMRDVSIVPIDVSLKLLELVHVRWTVLFDGMSESDFLRDVIHPDHEHKLTVDELLAIYSWHGEHHLAHVEAALQA